MFYLKETKNKLRTQIASNILLHLLKGLQKKIGTNNLIIFYFIISSFILHPNDINLQAI